MNHCLQFNKIPWFSGEVKDFQDAVDQHGEEAKEFLFLRLSYAGLFFYSTIHVLGFFLFVFFVVVIFSICKKEKAFSHNPLCHEGAQYYVSDLPLEGHIAPYTGALHIISFVSCQVGRLSLPIIKKLYLNILLFTLLLFL